MSQFPQSYEQQRRPYDLGYATDERVTFNFFNAVYAWMFVGLALTATVAYLCSQSPAMLEFMYGSRAVLFVAGLIAFVIAMAVQSVAMRIGAGAATALYLVYTAAIGMIISYIFVIYDMKILLTAFLMTAGVFGGMSVYGFITKRDLTKMGSILVMCVWGLILASVVNFFVASDALSWVITYAVLAVFIGLTAYHTQMLKQIAVATQGDPNMARRLAIVGSLMLYVAFLNIFLSILRILGSRR